MRFLRIGGRGLYALSFLVVCVCVTAAPAARLNLDHPHYPLVASSFIDVTYNPTGAGGCGRLTATGYSSELNRTGSATEPLYGRFDLTVDLNTANGQHIAGTLEVTEDTLTGVQLFYSQELTQFGFGTEVGDDIFECVFIQQGDMLADNGDQVGVILALTSNSAPWDFSSPFDNLFYGIPESGDGTSTTYYLPEPSMSILLAIAGVGLFRRRRR